jgi:hypothetical protein
MVAYAYVLSTLELRKKDHNFEASLGFKVRPCLKKKEFDRTQSQQKTV